jgi:hypothetical protein
MRTRERMRKLLKVPVLVGYETWGGSQSWLWLYLILVRDRGYRDSFFFWKCRFLKKNIIPFPPSLAKLISDYFYNRQCGANRSIALIMRQYIFSHRTVSVWMGGAVRTKKICEFFNHSRCKFGPHNLLKVKTRCFCFGPSMYCRSDHSDCSGFPGRYGVSWIRTPFVPAFRSFNLSRCSGHCNKKK